MNLILIIMLIAHPPHGWLFFKNLILLHELYPTPNCLIEPCDLTVTKNYNCGNFWHISNFQIVFIIGHVGTRWHSYEYLKIDLWINDFQLHYNAHCLMFSPPQFHRALGILWHSSSFHVGTKAGATWSATMPGTWESCRWWWWWQWYCLHAKLLGRKLFLIFQNKLSWEHLKCFPGGSLGAFLVITSVWKLKF